ncbi:hypothetical protein [Siphonobacter sp. SORGH_AS_1065]|uniref:hypothetical protein n=1 Tax=Siphonobacter sp. SORGH_AS_1065 TaxID=3041795 RepID=UPI002788BBCB|nr:hypothetical protein [Siphonobacter sp. SORGH_AS_1065]MDQ1086420.1 hypothetical protein [Siphonobacter sp. SORGH_AS_1065]
MRGSSIVLFILLSFTKLCAQDLDNGQIPFYAEPYYNYKPLRINIGKYSEQLKTNDTTQLLDLANKIKADINNVSIETLYVLSLRLYDLGKKDESFYWFHTAKTRARIFVEALDPEKIRGIGSEAFELKHLFTAFNQIVGSYINAYGFNDVEKAASTMEIIKTEIKNIKFYTSVYKKTKFLSDTKLEEIKTKKEKDIEESINYFRANKDEIKKKRIEAGIQDKY